MSDLPNSAQGRARAKGSRLTLLLAGDKVGVVDLQHSIRVWLYHNFERVENLDIPALGCSKQPAKDWPPTPHKSACRPLQSDDSSAVVLTLGVWIA